MSRQVVESLLLGSLLALLGWVGLILGDTIGWERSLGLRSLFHARGPISAPDDVVVVAIDADTGTELGMGPRPADWSRHVHADLLNKLTRAEAGLVAFDMFFPEPAEAGGDEAFARALGRAPPTVLAARLLRERPTDTPGLVVNVEQLQEPHPLLRRHTTATAPFVLPRGSALVGSFWTFQPAAGGTPTLPTVMLALHYRSGLVHIASSLAALDTPQATTLAKELEHALGGRSPVRQALSTLREGLAAAPGLAAQLREQVRANRGALTDKQWRQFRALVELVTVSETRNFNFLGPPLSFRVLSYQQALNAPPAVFEDNIVLVGYTESRQPKQEDGFFTFYTRPDGLDISGVELAATAFANLRDGNDIRRIPDTHCLLFLLGYGLLLAAVFRLLPAGIGVITGLGLALALWGLALWLFTAYAHWLPWVSPSLIMTPAGMIAGLTLQYRDLRKDRDRIRKAFSYYLPEPVVEQLARKHGRAWHDGERVYGVCLASDVQGYASHAAQLEPGALRERLNAYYERLFPPVRRHGGIVSDVVGDAMLAIWPAAEKHPDSVRNACRAALEISSLTSLDEAPEAWTTRIGLDAGEVALGSVGALDHFEYRAVGDIVNTASRLESLNKLLGTGILVTGDMVPALDGFTLRPLGAFVLQGKAEAVTVVELMAPDERSAEERRTVVSRFAEALQAHRADPSHHTALALFQWLGTHYRDPPSRFYTQVLQNVHSDAVLGADGAIRVLTK